MAMAVRLIASHAQVMANHQARRDPTRFTVEELQQELRHRFRTLVTIEADSRDTCASGLVRFRLGFHGDTSRIIVRTLPVAAPEHFLVYTVGYEQSAEIRAIRRHSARSAAEELYRTYPSFH